MKNPILATRNDENFLLLQTQNTTISQNPNIINNNNSNSTSAQNQNNINSIITTNSADEPRRKRQDAARPNHILLFTIINPVYPINVVSYFDDLF